MKGSPLLASVASAMLVLLLYSGLLMSSVRSAAAVAVADAAFVTTEMAVVVDASTPETVPYAADASCTPVEFDIQFDEYPMEVAYDLVCDGKRIWNVDEGHFEVPFATHVEQACLASAKACQFTIYDNPDYGDGLSSPFSNRPGKFALTVNSESVLVYDGADEDVAAKYIELSSPVFCIGNQGCNKCVDVVLTLTLDDSPFDTGYSLYCGNSEIWNQPIATFASSNFSDTNIRDSVCVPHDVCCWFMLFDSPEPIRFALTYGDELVAQSDGLSGTASASANGFTELGYEFGDCDQCVDVQLSLTLDENPAETGYSLTCDDTVVWDMPRYSFLTSEGLAHKTITDSACVDSFACCILTIQDSPLWQDGLTSPQAGRPGRFRTTYGDANVAEYNGAKDGPFINLSYEFGECGTAVR